ncbi:MAG TPA: hypothetical protein VLH94_00115 [Spirochaetia bacterium]|nr:hypothetical protein [Spirochaetia bacterium]
MKKYLIVIILFVFGCIVLFEKFQEQDHRFLSLELFGKKSELKILRPGELEKGDIVKGEFTASYNNIGQVTVRFNNNYHDSEDILVFRLREKGEKDWYYQAKYKTDQFLAHRLFPFGFPAISNSAGKIYEFELESLNGIQGRGISIDIKKPIFTVKTMFTKDELVSNKKSLFFFIVQKIFNLTLYIPLFLYSYSLLLYYIFLHFLPIIKIKANSNVKKILKLMIIITITTIGAFIQEKVDDTTIAIVMSMYFLYSDKLKLESRVTIFLAAIQLSISLILLVFGISNQANNAAIWGYMLMCFAVIQQIAESLFHYSPKTSLEKFLSRD